MRAMQLAEAAPIGEDPLEPVERPIPEPGPGEVRIKNEACAICHTELHQIEGELAFHKQPVIPGHQLVGHVDALGADVTDIEKGARVGLPWFYSACGACEYCTNGLENLCADAKFTGYDVDGGYAEYTIAQAQYLPRVPDGLPAHRAAPLLCAGIIGYRSLRLAEVEPGSRVGLYGFGASAHLAIQVARHWDCEVYVFTRSDEHREQARRLGAVWAKGAEDDPGVKMEHSVLFAPAGHLVLDAMRALDKGGTLAINAIYLSPIPEMDYRKHLYFERTVRSVSNATPRDADEFLAIAAEIPIMPEIKIYPLEDANGALQDLKASRINGAGVLEIASERAQ